MKISVTATIRIKLTPAQVAAMQCRDWSEEPLTTAAWDGASILAFDPKDRGGLFDELTDASNAEDAWAEHGSDPQFRQESRRASRALGNVATKVLRSVI